MLYIFHGDGTSASRKLLQESLVKEKSLGREIRVIEGDKLLVKDLDTHLSTASLFSTESLLIENLLGRLRSKEKDACIQLLAEYQGDKNIFLWDKREVTKPNMAKLAGVAKISLSKAPTALFTLLESLIPGSAKQSLDLLHQVVRESEDIVVFTMIARQISYLIIMKTATSPKFAPWTMAKLKTQSTLWETKSLEHFLSELLKIDFAIKTGRSKLSYTDHLDLLLLIY